MQCKEVPLTGGNEMTNNTAIGTSQPTFKLESTGSVYSIVHHRVRVLIGPLTSCSHLVAGVNQFTICVW